MSTKAIAVTKPAICEQDDQTYRLGVTADFITGPDYIYVSVSRDGLGGWHHSYEIAAQDARDIAHFILAETRPFNRDTLETKIRLVEELAVKWAERAEGHPYGYYMTRCVRELRQALGGS